MFVSDSMKFIRNMKKKENCFSIHNSRSNKISNKNVNDKRSKRESNSEYIDKYQLSNFLISKQRSGSVISNVDHNLNYPSLLGFTKLDMNDCFLLRPNNTSCSQILSNNSESEIEDYTSGFVNNKLKEKSSFAEEKISYSKRIKNVKNLISCTKKKLNDKNIIHLNTSAIKELSPELNTTNNSKNDPQLNSNKISNKPDEFVESSRDFQVLCKNESLSKESSKHSSDSLGLNNNLFSNNLHLEISHFHLCLSKHRELTNNDFKGNSETINHILNKRKNLDLTLPFNLFQNKINRYYPQKKLDRNLEIVKNVCEITYLKLCENYSNGIKDDDDYDLYVYDIEEVIIFNRSM